MTQIVKIEWSQDPYYSELYWSSGGCKVTARVTAMTSLPEHEGGIYTTSEGFLGAAVLYGDQADRAQHPLIDGGCGPWLWQALTNGRPSECLGEDIYDLIAEGRCETARQAVAAAESALHGYDAVAAYAAFGAARRERHSKLDEARAELAAAIAGETPC